MKKKNLTICITIFISIISIISIISYYKYSKEKNVFRVDKVVSDDDSYNSNIMENVSYSSKDAKGNEYIVNASQGEIDYDKPNVIYLTDVKAFIKLANTNNVKFSEGKGSTICKESPIKV